MKRVDFGDIHMAASMLPPIEELSRAELATVTGDLTGRPCKVETRQVLPRILCFKQELLRLAGNMDNGGVNDYLEDSGLNLHGQAI